jgi:predicted dehydrogenase
VGESLKVGIIGCGAIAAQYLQTFAVLDAIELIAVADLDPARAQAVAESQQGVEALSVEELLARPEIDTVVNLTVPMAHAQVCQDIIAAGKSVYVEKPLAADTMAARGILEAAAAAGVAVGCAPDTVLGTGIQTARKAIDDGLVGRPMFATATMVAAGHELWHPNPDYYYLPGGGPLLDMGPYYITTLVTLLGPVVRVIGAASALRDTRTIAGGPRAGEVVPVKTDTHVTGVLVHESGALSTLVMSFDGVKTGAAPIEVHGDLATLRVPDPNRFEGEVALFELGGTQWSVLEPSAGHVGASRGYGLLDLATTRDGEPRAGGTLAYHVLEVMEAVLASAADGRSVSITSSTPRPEGVPLQTR